MCDFLSWIKDGENVYVITDAELKSDRGKELLKESGSQIDALGHGFLRKYYDLGNVGIDCETDKIFDKNLPQHIKDLVSGVGLRKNFSEILKIGGSLDVSGCDLKGVALPTKIGDSLDVSRCDLKGVTLPTEIGGSLDVRGCDLKGVTLPKGVNVSAAL